MIRILAIGDSLTVGYQDRIKKYLPDSDVIREGHVGWTIPSLAKRMTQIASSIDPHFVLLMGGTNDANGGASPLEVGSRMRHWQALAASLFPNAVILSARPPKLRGARVFEGVDVSEDFEDLIPGADRVHLTGSGYDAMASRWVNLIKGIIDSRGRATRDLSASSVTPLFALGGAALFSYLLLRKR